MGRQEPDNYHPSIIIDIHPVLSEGPFYTNALEVLVRAKVVYRVFVFSKMIFAKFKKGFNTHKTKVVVLFCLIATSQSQPAQGEEAS